MFDEEFDYVVVGSGSGAMVAALVMADAGKSALVLEKTDQFGGTTARSGGAMWIPNNRFMKQDGIEDSTEKAMTYLDNLAEEDTDSPAATHERRLRYVEEAPRMIDYVSSHGVRLTRTDFWPDYYDNRPGGRRDSRSVFSEVFDLKELGEWSDKVRVGLIPQPVNLADFLPLSQEKKKKLASRLTIMLGSMDLGQMMKLPWFKSQLSGFLMMLRVAFKWLFGKLAGKRYVGAGVALQGQMLKAALNAGTDVRLNAPVNELLFEGEKVVGVVTEKDGKPWRVGARLGVLVNAGGFSHNQAMRDEYIPGTKNEWTSAAEGDTGEMIQEMMRNGAAVAQMDARVGSQITTMPGYEQMMVKPSMQATTGKPHCILVDQTGVRYQTEGGSYSAYCRGMLERNKTVPAIPSWAIFDERILTDYMFAGGMPGDGIHKAPAWVESGFMKKADTLESLAEQLDMDPATLSATVSRFNGFVDKGVDEDFHRGESHYDDWLGDRFRESSTSLGRIEKAPFYAAPVVPGDMTTYGGVMTDSDARVLREDGSVIGGLYATGVSTASVMGQTYPGGGASVGPGMTFGYIAARHAAGVEK